MAYVGHSSNSTTVHATSVAVSTSLTPAGGVGSPVKAPAGTVVLAMMQGGTNTATLTAPAGWTAIPNCAQQVTGNVGVQGGWYRVFDGTEPASYTFTSSANDFQTAALLGFSGRNTSSPFTASVSTPNQFSASPLVLACNALTAAAGDDVVILGGNRFYNGSNAVSYAPPVGFGFGNSIYGNVQYSPVAFFSVDQAVAAGSYGAAGGTITVPVDTTSQGATVYVVSLAQNTAAATYSSFSGTGWVEFVGALQLVDNSNTAGYGVFTFTGQNLSATVGSVFAGTLVGNPDWVAVLPYRSFTVVLP